MSEPDDRYPALVRTTSHPDGRDEIVTADADDLLETVTTTPALRDLHPGTISSYRLDTAVLPPEVLVGALRVVGDAAEDTGHWPEDLAEDWVDSDEELAGDLHGLDLVARWVEIDEQRVAVVRTGDGVLVPVLVDQDLMRLETVTSLAEHSWSDDGGGRPMSTDGGNGVGLLRDGVLYEYQWGDLGHEHLVRTVGTTADEVGAAVADWVSRAEIDQTVALALEPVDPGGTLRESERAALRAALGGCGIGFSIDDDAVESSAREHLVRIDERYRRTRDALAEPGSLDGKLLFAAIAAVRDGEEEPTTLTFATWMP